MSASGAVFQLSPQAAQRRDDVPAKICDRGLGARQACVIQAGASAEAKPQAEQDQVDVVAALVLQADQRVGDARPAVEHQRKSPKGIRRSVLSRHAITAQSN
jgi:hypothetical protein